MAKYRVDFRDMIDGWIGGTVDNPNEFDDLDQAKALRDKRNDELAVGNKKAGEHFGVIDLENNREIDCPTENPDWLPDPVLKERKDNADFVAACMKELKERKPPGFNPLIIDLIADGILGPIEKSIRKHDLVIMRGEEVIWKIK